PAVSRETRLVCGASWGLSQWIVVEGRPRPGAGSSGAASGWEVGEGGGLVGGGREVLRMSVSLYYSATRATPLTDAESAAVERIVAAHQASFPYEYEESLYLYDRGAGEPDEIVA